MQHADFIAWMILYPFFMTLAEVIEWQWGQRREYSVETRGLAAVFHMALWLSVGFGVLL